MLKKNWFKAKKGFDKKKVKELLETEAGHEYAYVMETVIDRSVSIGMFPGGLKDMLQLIMLSVMTVSYLRAKNNEAVYSSSISNMLEDILMNKEELSKIMKQCHANVKAYERKRAIEIERGLTFIHKGTETSN